MSTAPDPSPIPLHAGPGENGSEPDSPQLLADPVAYLTAGYRRHGPVFRTRYRGQDWVTIAGIEANDFFWQNTADWSYELAGPGFREQFGPRYVTQLDGPAHLRKRRLLKAGFSAEAVGRYLPVMAAATERFLSDPSPWGTDANAWIPALLLTLNGATLLQRELTAEQMRDAIRLEAEMLYGVAVAADRAAYFARPGYAERKARVFAWIDAELDDRLDGRRVDDNLQALIDQDSAAPGAPARDELRNDAYMLLVAGIHNTSTLLLKILERLAQDPAWVAELRSELAGYSPASFSSGMGSFPKLRATILEGERLHPGATFLKRRPVADLRFGGYAIPARTPVMQAHTLPHFLAEYYPDPLRFHPARWLDSSAPPRKALADFGGGAHICVGMNLTRIQIPVVLAEILLRYDWRLGYAPDFVNHVDRGHGLDESSEPVMLTRR